jgi:hypothetical protein
MSLSPVSFELRTTTRAKKTVPPILYTCGRIQPASDARLCLAVAAFLQPGLTPSPTGDTGTISVLTPIECASNGALSNREEVLPLGSAPEYKSWNT